MRVLIFAGVSLLAAGQAVADDAELLTRGTWACKMKHEQAAVEAQVEWTFAPGGKWSMKGWMGEAGEDARFKASYRIEGGWALKERQLTLIPEPGTMTVLEVITDGRAEPPAAVAELQAQIRRQPTPTNIDAETVAELDEKRLVMRNPRSVTTCARKAAGSGV